MSFHWGLITQMITLSDITVSAQVFIAGILLLLSLLSYTYATKSHLHSMVEQIEPMRIDGIIIKPTILEIRWRPELWILRGWWVSKKEQQSSLTRIL